MGHRLLYLILEKVTLFKTPYIWQDNHNYEVKSVFINLSALWIVR